MVEISFNYYIAYGINPIKPGPGALSALPFEFLLIAHKRMLRSIRNFLTFPKYQKRKIWKNFDLIFLPLPPWGGGSKKSRSMKI